MSYSIRIYGDPVLREQSREVASFDEKLSDFAGYLVKAMQDDSGLGLAAPQIGVLDRVVAIDRSFGESGDDIWVLVNPEVIETDGKCTFEEGCLSVPGIYEDVVRPESVRLKYQDLDGVEHVVDVDGLLARVFQHEADHLDGVLFVDRLSVVKRQILARSLKSLAEKGTIG